MVLGQGVVIYRHACYLNMYDISRTFGEIIDIRNHQLCFFICALIAYPFEISSLKNEKKKNNDKIRVRFWSFTCDKKVQ